MMLDEKRDRQIVWKHNFRFVTRPSDWNRISTICWQTGKALIMIRLATQETAIEKSEQEELRLVLVGLLMTHIAFILFY